ncbi:RHS repeat-associated core domain-containing protein [Muricauda brasiliensis]|uniref:RHS repeat-associated core domain-containing protein n=1 Tax=Muricauda brasiliensis TaxID=2162892 RepID=UPI000D3809B4|nr:RHS repeat-associated core domain-containing protein [Muricauda brasiliensis]
MKNLTIIFCALFSFMVFSQERPIKMHKAKEVKKTVYGEGTTNISSRSFSTSSMSGAIGGGTVNGSIVADLSVSSSGAVNYTVPIDIPPGLNGIQPEVSLDFDSQTGNGLAGWGWNLSGISVITRIPSTKFHDNQIDPVDFDLDDRFALDGQRLIVKKGTYGVAGSEYQTEQYSNLKIVAYGSNPISQVEGPEYFKVFYPDGSIGYYGNNANSRSATDYAITYWENPQGNRISYEYLSSNNTLRISKIKYGSIGESAPINEIEFKYTWRKFNEMAYVGGVQFARTHLLRTINVFGNGRKQYRKYYLGHADYTHLRYQRLSSIYQYNSDDSENRHINFTYDGISISTGGGDYDLKTSYFNENGGVAQIDISDIEQRNAEVVSLDFTGNGKMDFFVYPTMGSDAKKKLWLYDNIQSSINFSDAINVGSFLEVFPVNWLNQNNQLMNSQGLAIVKNSGNDQVDFEVRTTISTGPITTAYTKTWSAPTYKPENYQLNGNPSVNRVPLRYVSGDFDGDGLSDIIALERTYTTTSCFEQPAASNPSCEDKVYRDGVGYCCYGCTTSTNNLSSSRAHLIKLDRRITNGFVSNIGSLSEQLGVTDKLLSIDANGDGRTNIVQVKSGKVIVYGLNKTNSYLVKLWETTDSDIDLSFPLLPGDYNGDGKGDFLLPKANNSGGHLMFISTGKGYYVLDQGWSFTFRFSEDTGGTYYGYNLIPADINGDGKTDIIEYNTQVDHNSTTGTQSIKIHQNVVITNTPSSNLNPVFFASNSTNSTVNMSAFPIPIFLSSNKPNGNLEFASISNKWVKSFEFLKDHRDDVSLVEIENNGVVTDIKYDQVNAAYWDTDDTTFEKAYTSPNTYRSQTYPFVNINSDPSFKVVRELEQTGAGMARKKQFYYEGAVSHANGLGFLGFEVMKQSNWYGDNVPAVWSISKYDPLLRGAIKEMIVSNTYINNPASYMSKVNYHYDYKLIANPGSPIAPEYLENITRGNSLTSVQTDVAEQSITLEPGFHSIGGSTDYWGYIFPPEEQPGDAGYAGAVDIRLNKMETDNGLTGVFTTETYTYDQYNNPLVTTTTYPGGSKTITNQYLNNPTAANSTYHIGRLKKMTERVVLNGNSFSTETQYTYNNNQVTQIKKKGNGTGWLTEDFTHHANGNIHTKTLSGDGVGTRTEIYEYSLDFDSRFLTKSTDMEGLITTFSYDDVTGSILSTIDPYGLTTDYEYDKWGRIKKETDYLNNATDHTYTILSGGALRHNVDYATGAKEQTTYNAFGWTVQKGVMSLNNQWVYTDYEYYVDGKLKRESEPHNSSPSQWNTTVYEVYGRPINQTLATGRNISYTYTDPGLSYTVNDGSKTTTITSDALGNTVKVSNLGGTVDYTYYANGTMKTADHDGGNLISVGIDGWGRKTSLNDPSAGSYSYTYNAFGELLTETGPKGVTTYIYDNYGKIVSKTVEGDLTDLSLSYIYDPVTKLLTDIDGTDNTNSGRAYSYDYEYDIYERPDKIIENTGLASFEYEMVYDTYGRVEKEFQTSTLGGTSKIVKTKNVYDTTSGLLKEIWSDSSTPEKLWELNSINARGQALTVTLGNGMVKNSTYDAYGYVTKIEDKESGTNPTVALHTEYDFNAQEGTLNNRENFGFGWEETFGYDNLDRLTTISGDVSHTMNYQSNGNININSSLGTYGYGDTSKKHRLTEIDPNPAGETYFQQHPTQQVSYNAFKKPVDIHQSGHGRVSFEYGPLMNRSTAYYGGEQSDRSQRRYKKHYSAIFPAEIVEDTQAGTTKFIAYVGGDAYSAPIAHIKITGGGSTLDEYHYLHRDYLGSILAITDADGDVKEERQFGAWGKVDQFLDSGGGTTFGHNALLGRGFTGHEHFFEIGLIHMNGRMYDPQLGRFLSPDNNIQDPFNTQNYNRYGYVLNNPLMYTDPSGERFLGFLGDFWGGIGSFIGNIAGTIARWLGWDGSYDDYVMGTIYENPAPTPSNNTGNSQMASSVSTNRMRQSTGGPGPWSGINVAWNKLKKSSLEFMVGTNIGHQMFIENTINGITKGLPAFANSTLLANGFIVNGAFEDGFDIYFDNGIAIIEGVLTPIDQGIRGINQLMDGNFFEAGVNLSQASDAVALALATEGAGAGVNFASRGLSGISKLSRTTRGLQRYVTRAAREVDALGDAAFTAKQLQAIKRNPNLRPAFRGNRIDVRARQLIKKDSEFNNLIKNYSRGPDFVDPSNGTWWDITTPGAWERHVRKYGPGGILLRTQAK